jgi:hypothetical protein
VEVSEELKGEFNLESLTTSLDEDGWNTLPTFWISSSSAPDTR